MPNKTSQIFITIILILVGALVVQRCSNQRLSDDNTRLAKNQSSMIRGLDFLVLSHKEMKEYLASYDETLLARISDSIKAKVTVHNLNKYSRVTNIYKDTTILEVPLTSDPEFPDKLFFTHIDSCWGGKGYLNTLQNTLTYTERTATSTAIRVDYVKREKILTWLFGGVRLGKKKAGVYVESNCGQAITKEVEVE